MGNIRQAQAFPGLVGNLAHKGCFLVTGKESPNIMTIGWATAGVMWGKEVLMVPVRLSRYSHDKLEAWPEFTVCTMESTGQFAHELAVCGSKSGRDMDKAAELGFTLQPSETISVPYIGECDLAYECKVIYKLEMTEAHMDRAVVDRFYPAANYHTLYFGEILAVHKK